MPAKADHGLKLLLELDDEIFQPEGGYWTKFEVREVVPTPEIPHGIRYSLTLHDRHGTRLLGYDNAHALPKATKHATRVVEWDHRHSRDIVRAYRFVNSGKLLEDFWKSVDEFVPGE